MRGQLERLVLSPHVSQANVHCLGDASALQYSGCTITAPHVSDVRFDLITLQAWLLHSLCEHTLIPACFLCHPTSCV